MRSIFFLALLFAFSWAQSSMYFIVQDYDNNVVECDGSAIVPYSATLEGACLQTGNLYRLSFQSITCGDNEAISTLYNDSSCTVPFSKDVIPFGCNGGQRTSCATLSTLGEVLVDFAGYASEAECESGNNPVFMGYSPTGTCSSYPADATSFEASCNPLGTNQFSNSNCTGPAQFKPSLISPCYFFQRERYFRRMGFCLKE
jgi:hypothetical protein